MFATIFYWIVIALAIMWGAWSLIWSIVYLTKHENGNLWIFAIINTLGALVLGLIYWIYSSEGNQWFWFASKRADIGWLVYVLLFYIVLVIFQAICGITRHPKKA